MRTRNFKLFFGACLALGPLSSAAALPPKSMREKPEVIRVRAVVAPSYVRFTGWEDRIRKRLEFASAELEKRFGVSLEQVLPNVRWEGKEMEFPSFPDEVQKKYTLEQLNTDLIAVFQAKELHLSKGQKITMEGGSTTPFSTLLSFVEIHPYEEACVSYATFLHELAHVYGAFHIPAATPSLMNLNLHWKPSDLPHPESCVIPWDEQTQDLLKTTLSLDLRHGVEGLSREDTARLSEIFSRGHEPDWPHPVANAYLVKGERAYRNRRHSESVEWYQKAIAVDQNYPALHGLLGMSWVALSENEKARSELELYLRGMPNSPGGRWNLAVVLLSLGQTSEARRQLQILRTAGHFVADVHAVLGNIAVHLDEFAEAEKHFMASLAASRNQNPMARTGMAEIGKWKQNREYKIRMNVALDMRVIDLPNQP